VRDINTVYTEISEVFRITFQITIACGKSKEERHHDMERERQGERSKQDQIDEYTFFPGRCRTFWRKNQTVRDYLEKVIM
jgi:hypothetical protein